MGNKLLLFLASLFSILNTYGMEQSQALAQRPKFKRTESNNRIGFEGSHQFSLHCLPKETLQAWEQEDPNRLQETMKKPVFPKILKILNAVKVAADTGADTSRAIQECCKGLVHQQWPQLLTVAHQCKIPARVQNLLALTCAQSVPSGVWLPLNSPELAASPEIKKDLHKYYYLVHKNAHHEKEIARGGYPEISLAELVHFKHLDSDPIKKVRNFKGSLPCGMKLRDLADDEYVLDLKERLLTTLEGFEQLTDQSSPYHRQMNQISVVDLRNNHLQTLCLDGFKGLPKLKFLLLDHHTQCESNSAPLNYQECTAKFHLTPAALVKTVCFSRNSNPLVISTKNPYEVTNPMPHSLMSSFISLFRSRNYTETSLEQLMEEYRNEKAQRNQLREDAIESRAASALLQAYYEESRGIIETEFRDLVCRNLTAAEADRFKIDEVTLKIIASQEASFNAQIKEKDSRITQLEKHIREKIETALELPLERAALIIQVEKQKIERNKLANDYEVAEKTCDQIRSKAEQESPEEFSLAGVDFHFTKVRPLGEQILFKSWLIAKREKEIGLQTAIIQSYTSQNLVNHLWQLTKELDKETTRPELEVDYTEIEEKDPFGLKRKRKIVLGFDIKMI